MERVERVSFVDPIFSEANPRPHSTTGHGLWVGPDFFYFLEMMTFEVLLL